MNWQIPYLTADLPGVGGEIRRVPEDFIVEEVPLYPLCGEGEHTFFAVEKRGISTPALVQKLSRALQIPGTAISYAGLKDAQALTQQVLSVQGVSPEQLLALDLEEGIQILWATRHKNKLRIGHLKGNNFIIRIHRVHPDAGTRAAAILAVLARRGVPNGYGSQRFGNRGTNHEIGYALLHDDREALRSHGIRSLPFRQRRFYLSALQSALFNQYLTARLNQGTMDQVLLGDVAKKHDTGGLFTVEDVEVACQRVVNWEISATGPIYGYKMLQAKDAAGELESRILSEAGLDLEDFRPVKSKGSRRFLRYQPEGLHWEIEDTDLIVSFFAPKGSFATMLLRELLKTEVISGEEDEDAED